MRPAQRTEEQHRTELRGGEEPERHAAVGELEHEQVWATSVSQLPIWEIT